MSKAANKRVRRWLPYLVGACAVTAILAYSLREPPDGLRVVLLCVTNYPNNVEPIAIYSIQNVATRNLEFQTLLLPSTPQPTMAAFKGRVPESGSVSPGRAARVGHRMPLEEMSCRLLVRYRSWPSDWERRMDELIESAKRRVRGSILQAPIKPHPWRIAWSSPVSSGELNRPATGSVP